MSDLETDVLRESLKSPRRRYASEAADKRIAELEDALESSRAETQRERDRAEALEGKLRAIAAALLDDDERIMKDSEFEDWY